MSKISNKPVINGQKGMAVLKETTVEIMKDLTGFIALVKTEKMKESFQNFESGILVEGESNLFILLGLFALQTFYLTKNDSLRKAFIDAFSHMKQNDQKPDTRLQLDELKQTLDSFLTLYFNDIEMQTEHLRITRNLMSQVKELSKFTDTLYQLTRACIIWYYFKKKDTSSADYKNLCLKAWSYDVSNMREYIDMMGNFLNIKIMVYPIEDHVQTLSPKPFGKGDKVFHLVIISSKLKNNRIYQIFPKEINLKLNRNSNIGIKTENGSNLESFDTNECDICHMLISREFVFQNNLCFHKYCYYCLKDIAEIRNDCYLRRCNGRLDQNEIKKFIEKSDQKNQLVLNNSSKTSVVDQENIIGQCKKCLEKSKIKDLIKGIKCGHTLCEKCLMSQSNYTKRCPVYSCYEEIDTSNTMTKINKLSRCQKCLQEYESSALFRNNQCNHSLCIDCAKKIKDSYCPCAQCYSRFDQTLFQEFLLSQDATNILHQNVTCTSCHKAHEVPYQNNSQPDYFKCPSCGMLMCCKHNEPMEKCLCLCPGCLSSFNEVSQMKKVICKKCFKAFCTICKSSFQLDIPSCSCERSISQQSYSQVSTLDKEMRIETQQDNQNNSKICDNCQDFSLEEPFTQLKCLHTFCNFCILNNPKTFSSKGIRCLICQ